MHYLCSPFTNFFLHRSSPGRKSFNLLKNNENRHSSSTLKPFQQLLHFHINFDQDKKIKNEINFEKWNFRPYSSLRFHPHLNFPFSHSIRSTTFDWPKERKIHAKKKVNKKIFSQEGWKHNWDQVSEIGLSVVTQVTCRLRSRLMDANQIHL